MKLRWLCALFALLCVGVASSEAQGPRPRLAAPVDGSLRVPFAGARPTFITQGVDQGALPSITELRNVTLVFKRSEAQQADLDALLAAQQNTQSSLYHQWLTPDLFAARFGMAQEDLNRVQAWLAAQGLTVIGASRSRNSISFNGTEAQIAAAFGSEVHRYKVDGEERFGPAQELSLPASLAPVTLAVLHLSDLHPHSRLRVLSRPRLTSAQTGNEFLTPGDVATMYDVKPVYAAGYTGAGQSIAVLGQSFVDTSAVTTFQAAANLSPNLPSLVLVPQTGLPGVNAFEDGDEEESQLDLEYASGMAPGAQIYMVYTGDALNSGGVFESLAYAIDQNLAPIVSGSYGVCETALVTSSGAPSQDALAIQAEMQQANAQGQTVLFSSGDDGSTDCYGVSSFSAAQRAALAVDFPASIPYATSMGGLQMQTGTYYKSTTGTGTSAQYWQSATGSDVISSLLSYVPETVWNESTLSGTTLSIGAGGGGVSGLFARPSWQAGVTGIPAGTMRLVPDISLQASTSSPGYVFCTTDPSALASYGESATCTNGLRSADGTFTPAGGTSFAAPIMAGLLAVLNQAKHATGQGNINPTLYGLAANSTTYASVFHDITTGKNACPTGASACAAAAQSNYSATTGFDLATGLGSFDFAKLVSAWPAPSGVSATAVSSTLSLTAATLTPASGASDVVTITVNGSSSGATPTGTVLLQVDGSSTPVTLFLSGGKATYTYPGTTISGSHTLVATYSGDPSYLPSKGSLVLTLSGSTSITGSFALSSTNISLAYNGQGQGTITVVPSAGYGGTIGFALSVPSSAPTLCYATASTQQGGSNVSTNQGKSGPITATLTLYEGTQCGTAALREGGGIHDLLSPGRRPSSPLSSPFLPGGVALACLLGVPFASRKRRKHLPQLLCLLAVTAGAWSLSGCGGGAGNTITGGGGGTTTNQTQTVTLTLTGTDSVNSSLTASTTLTVTVHP